MLRGNVKNAAWAEWSVERQSDPHDSELWYETNPSLGTVFTERSVEDEIGTDDVDFNIQRLGLWIAYSQKSAISRPVWDGLKAETLPKFAGDLFVGIKYSKTGNVALSIAVKTEENNIFVESVDCRPISAGNQWILDFLRKAQYESVTVDGANGQGLLADAMKAAKLKAPELPTVGEIINANAAFEAAVNAKTLCHAGQASLTQIATNCDHRAIGTNGGFGFVSLRDGADIALLDSVILAHYACTNYKPRKKQSFSY